MAKQNKKQNPDALYKSTSELIAGYNLTANYGKEQARSAGGTGRLVYLIGRPLASGNVSLIRYSFHNGERQRESTGKVLRVELDATIKAANKEIVRQERIMCDEVEKSLLITGKEFVASSLGKMMLSDYLCPDRERKTTSMDAVSCTMRTLSNHVKEFGDVKVRDVTESWVRGFLSYLKDAKCLNYKSKEKNLSPNTQHKLSVVLSVALNRAVTEKRLISNPFHNLSSKERIKGNPSTRTFLELSEVQKLANTECVGDTKFGYHIKQSFLFSVNVGLRFSDVIKLRMIDFETDENGVHLSITQTKTDEPLFTYVSDYALSLLPNVEDATKPIFNIPSSKTANFWLSEWVKAAGITKHITFHCSRHTCATLLLSNGMGLQNVQAQLGHSSSKTTEVYAKLVNSARKQTANKMDEIMNNL